MVEEYKEQLVKRGTDQTGDGEFVKSIIDQYFNQSLDHFAVN